MGMTNYPKLKLRQMIKKKRIFYTALYHFMIAPNLYQDLNGEYRGADDKIYKDDTFINYTYFPFGILTGLRIHFIPSHIQRGLVILLIQ